MNERSPECLERLDHAGGVPEGGDAAHNAGLEVLDGAENCQRNDGALPHLSGTLVVQRDDLPGLTQRVEQRRR